MKKQTPFRLLVWALIAVMPLWFGSCGKSSDSVTPTSSTIEGTWQYTGLKISPAMDLLGTGTKTNDLLAALATFTGSTDVTTCFTTTKITFISGGKTSVVPGPKCTTTTTSTDMVDANSTWKLDGSKLTITDSTGKSEVLDVAQSGNSLKLSQTDSSTDYDGDGKNDTVTITLELTKV